MNFRFIQFSFALAASIPLGSEANLFKRGDFLGRPLHLKSMTQSASQSVQEFLIGDPNASQKTFVKIYHQTNELSRRDTASNSSSSKDNHTVIDMTPSTCTSQACYTGSFQGPKKEDCDVVVAAQLYNSTGSLAAFPGTFVLVYSGTCAVVFQNPMANSDYTLQYNWASLGKVMQDLTSGCFKPDEQSIGGACLIAHYLKFNFKNVVISLQRYTADPPAPSPS